MRFASLTPFDDYVPQNAISEQTAVYTPTSFNDMLGHYDEFSYQCLVDNANVAGVTLTLQCQHSSDGRNWLDRGSPNTISTALTTLQWMYGADSGGVVGTPGPLLGFVRFAFWFTGAACTAHVKLHVTLRDGR